MPINRPYTSIWVLEERYRPCISRGPLQTVYKLFYCILARRTGFPTIDLLILRGSRPSLLTTSEER